MLISSQQFLLLQLFCFCFHNYNRTHGLFVSLLWFSTSMKCHIVCLIVDICNVSSFVIRRDVSLLSNKVIYVCILNVLVITFNSFKCVNILPLGLFKYMTKWISRIPICPSDKLLFIYMSSYLISSEKEYCLHQFFLSHTIILSKSLSTL